jgi:hypothetical protein
MKVYLVWFDNIGELELVKIFMIEEMAHKYCSLKNVDSEIKKGYKYYVEVKWVE